MPSFPKPAFNYTFPLNREVKALRKYRDTKAGRQIPAGKPFNIRLATWNIANLGAQDRDEAHLKIIAEILSWFDLIAIQETKEDSAHFQKIVKWMGKPYTFIFSDESGNNERLAFIYNSEKITLLQEVAELSIPPSDFKHIKLPGVSTKFDGFDRAPFMVSFRVKNYSFVLLNVHLYFGDDSESASIDRRCLEAYAVARWADLRGKSKYAYTCNVIAMGDFNLPKVDETDPVYKALLGRGLQLPEHTTKIFSNISNDKAYDQIAFLPGLQMRIIAHGVFDYDNALFSDLYTSRTAAEFRAYLRYYISDHRPMWLELDVKDP